MSFKPIRKLTVSRTPQENCTCTVRVACSMPISPPLQAIQKLAEHAAFSNWADARQANQVLLGSRTAHKA